MNLRIISSLIHCMIKIILGVCRCDHDFFGIDCSNEKTKAPLIETSAFESICDSSKRPCKTIIIPGLDFYPENLTCKFRPFQVICSGNSCTKKVGKKTIIINVNCI